MAASSIGSRTRNLVPILKSFTAISACKIGTRQGSTGGRSMKRLISLTALVIALGCGAAQAQYTGGTIKIGVMNDMSGTYADLSGQGSVVAARMAVEDFGAVRKGMKVEIVGADHQNKPDVGSNIV